MDAKVSGEFWEDELTGELSPEEKLCALWLITNGRRKLSGYTEITERVFKFHTGLELEALERTLQALPKSFIRVGKGVWLKNFIRRQFGVKDALANNNCTKTLCREIDALGMDDLRQLVAKEYPEIRHLLFPSSSPQKNKPLPTPYQGGREEKSREEYGRGTGETAIQGDLLGENPPDSALPTSQLDADFSKKNPAATGEKNGADFVPRAEQVQRFSALFGRPVGARWSYAEETALSAAQPVSEADLKLVEWRYRQPEEEGDPHRKRLARLLENLPGEIDAARAQWKRLPGGTATTPKRKEPEGWLEILEKKYRRPEDTEWQAPESFFKLSALVQAEILKEIEQQKNLRK